MKKVLEMREKRAKAWDAAKAFLDARADGNVLSAEDNATYEKMVADVDAMARQIAIEEDRVARDAAMAQPTSSPMLLPSRQVPTQSLSVTSRTTGLPTAAAERCAVQTNFTSPTFRPASTLFSVWTLRLCCQRASSS